ncbi:hypothetical protein OG2516_02634 [Oceanicola granulosus HTCC2516]|uniref:DUF1289 domain-containing protein n=1 Tax=Oceanicola granulosus (strain ATCC BAA-861 / DSM 15982 / KCTC 12143 / HTCC2516) TaxID=314256 RepID=Q2CHJ7_OCEGH|nr:DUF1289 domain-containing protein [Oceanicola granulosus]EAR52297.1 hypothetical protein OG2516_02634 [Oceanicola granulosus HTCC2516]
MSRPEDPGAVWSRAEVESPCVRVCVVHPSARICTGCLRTLDEIAAWSRMSPDERRAIMADLPTRKPLLARRRGGRAARLDRES